MIDLRTVKLVFCDKKIKINLIGLLLSIFIMFMCLQNLQILYASQKIAYAEVMIYHAIGLVGLYFSTETSAAFVYRLYKLFEKRKRLY